MQTKHSAGWLVWALILIAAGCWGCGGGQLPSNTNGEDAPGIGWPPPELPARTVNTITHVQAGSDAVDSGGDAVIDSNDMVLNTGSTVAWALYSIGGQTDVDKLSDISVDYTVTPEAANDGSRLFLGFANYDLEIWEWVLPETSPYTREFTNPDAYISDGGQSHIVAVMDGPGEGRVSQVSFETTGSYVDPPANLTAEATGIDLVELDWDDVDGAGSYNIYRADNAALTGVEQVNAEPVAASEYNDTGLGETYYYYYYVTAVSANESAPSNVASTWIFKADYAAATNLRVTNRAETSFTLEWDWEGSYPEDGFVIYYDFTPDFIITDDTLHLHERWDYTFTMNNTEPGFVYYWKLAALEDGPHDIDRQIHGRLSAEATATCTGFWTWGDVNTIATGLTPVRAARHGDEIVVAYRSGSNVDVAVGLDDTWTTSTALSGSGDTFGEQLDMASNGTTVIVVSEEKSANDAHAAYGTPGSWTNDRVHGDGSTALFHPCSGAYAACAIDDTEMAIIHHDEENTTSPVLRYHTRPIAGGSWSSQVLRSGVDSGTSPQIACAYHEANLYVLNTYVGTDELSFADESGGWSWSNIIDVTEYPELALRQYHDLQYYQDQWYTTGFDNSDKDLYIMHGTSTPWTGEKVNDDSTILGYNARMDVEGEEAIVIFADNAKYYFAFYSKSWQYFDISVPGTADGDYAENADVVLLNGSPYFVFQDEGTGEIKIAMGSPPE